MIPNLTVLIISKNQASHIHPMLQNINTALPGARVLYVLDRTTDDSSRILTERGITHINKTSGWGFDPCGARNMGVAVAATGPILFLDGDRYVNGLTWDLVHEALGTYGITLVKAEYDFRTFFSEGFSVNTCLQYPGQEPYIRGDGHYDFGCYSCGLLISGEARTAILSKYPHLFCEIFRGRYGEEDNSLAAYACSMGITIGGFPDRVFVSGYFGGYPHDLCEIRTNQEKFRILLHDLGYQVSRPKPVQDKRGSLASCVLVKPSPSVRSWLPVKEALQDQIFTVYIVGALTKGTLGHLRKLSAGKAWEVSKKTMLVSWDPSWETLLAEEVSVNTHILEKSIFEEKTVELISSIATESVCTFNVVVDLAYVQSMVTVEEYSTELFELTLFWTQHLWECAWTLLRTYEVVGLRGPHTKDGHQLFAQAWVQSSTVNKTKCKTIQQLFMPYGITWHTLSNVYHKDSHKVLKGYTASTSYQAKGHV